MLGGVNVHMCVPHGALGTLGHRLLENFYPHAVSGHEPVLVMKRRSRNVLFTTVFLLNFPLFSFFLLLEKRFWHGHSFLITFALFFPLSCSPQARVETVKSL